jgi:anti-anti-sigma factor
VIALEGDLDLSREPELQALLPPVGAANRVVFDFSDVTSIDSSVITTIMRYRRDSAAKTGNQVEIVIVASASIRRVLDMVGISRVLTVIAASKQSPEDVSRLRG